MKVKKRENNCKNKILKITYIMTLKIHQNQKASNYLLKINKNLILRNIKQSKSYKNINMNSHNIKIYKNCQL